MSELLYIDCYGGFDSTMACGALLELGAEEEFVCRQMSLLFRKEIHPYIEKTAVKNHGITALKAEIKSKEKIRDYTLAEAKNLAARADMDSDVKKLICRMMTILEETADEYVLEMDISLGMLEMTAVAAAIVSLGIKKVCFSSIPEGMGTASVRGNRMMIPLPAVVRIAGKCHMRFRQVQEDIYLTETAAAIAAGICEDFSYLAEEYQIVRCGVGANDRGKVLRALIFSVNENVQEATESVWVLETNIDDASGEQLGYAIELLMKAGARDASAMPILMKKNRPAFLLQVICAEKEREMLENIIFHETTSIGLRKYREEREILPRHFEKITTPYGDVTCKTCMHHGTVFRYPEYEDVARIARETGRSFTEIYGMIKNLSG